MAASIRIQHLQWVVGAVAAFGCAILGGALIADNLTELNRAGRAVTDASRFSLIMAASDMISAERGPSNAAMDPTVETSEEAKRRLAAIRAVTDTRIAAAWAAASTESPHGLAQSFSSVDRRLAEARAKVDAICAKPAQERRGPAIVEAIEAMFAVADEAAVLRDEFGRRLLRDAPEVGTEVILQAEASALREQTGRLGSYAVMKLTGGLTAEEARIHSLRTQDSIRHIWQNLADFGKNYADDSTIGHALADVENSYFADSFLVAREVFEEPSLRTSASDFTRRYVPGLAAPSRLKDSLGALTLRKIEQAREAAIAATLASAAITATVLLALLWLGLTFRRRLFRPLIAVREQILSLSDGRLDEPAPLALCGPEVDEMFAGLAVLRGELRHKLVLERARRRMTRNLKVLSETDSLTGLLNRRAVAEQAPTMIEAADRMGHPVSAILADIDHFKTVNDVHGHAGGDAVLKRVAAILRSQVGQGDLIARYGGEEFLILVPGLDRTATEALAEAMRQNLAAMQCDRHGPAVVTGSFGIATRPPGSSLDWEALVARADSALYRAKRLGRNRVCGEAPTALPVDEPMAQRA